MGKCENAKIIKLRKLEPSDLPFLYQWENDASVWADGANHLSTLNFQPSTLGCIDLFDFDPRNRRAAIGMYIAPQYRGQGIGREAVRLLEKYAFDFLHMRIIYAIISTSNTACSELYRQAGYTPSSVLPSWTLEADAVLWFKQAS